MRCVVGEQRAERARTLPAALHKAAAAGDGEKRFPAESKKRPAEKKKEGKEGMCRFIYE